MAFNKRNSFADLGLVIALAVFIVMTIKSLLFGFSWGAIIWLTLSIAYLVASCLLPSDSKNMKYATGCFLLVSVIVFAGTILYDQNARPKMHAFEGAVNDTIEEEKFVVKDEPVVIKEVAPDTTHRDSIEMSDMDLDINLEDTEDDTKPVEEGGQTPVEEEF